MTWLIPLEELSIEQIRAVEASPDENRLVIGAPGSGKTQILLHRAAYLRNRLKTSGNRFQIFVFTNVLKDYISSALDMLDLPVSCVSTYDLWCREFYQANVSRNVPWNGKSPDFDAIRSGVHDFVLANVKSPLFDFVMVDEGQDLDPETFKVLDTIAGHVTVCADSKQQIYEYGSEESEIIDGLGLHRANNTLLEAFRCSPYIVSVAAALVDRREEAAALENQARTSTEGRETPLLYIADDFDDERARLIDIVRTRSMKGEKVGILLPHNRQVFGFAQGLSEAGLEVEIAARKGKSTDRIPLNFNSDRPKLMTYHSAKGLTFDTVILPRLVPNSFSNLTNERIKKLLFVGVTRATKWVYVSSTKASIVDPIEELMDLKDEGKLTVQHAGDPISVSRPTTTSDVGDDLTDLL